MSKLVSSSSTGSDFGGRASGAYPRGTTAGLGTDEGCRKPDEVDCVGRKDDDGRDKIDWTAEKPSAA